MEYVKVFLPATRKTRSLPGRVEQRWDAPLIPREVFEPRSRGGAGILRDIVQVSEPVAWPLSSCSTVFRPSELSFLLICSLSFSPAWPAVTFLLPFSPLFKTLSLIRRRRSPLSLFLAPRSIPFKEGGIKRNCVLFKRKETIRRRNRFIIQERERETSLSFDYITFSSTIHQYSCLNLYDDSKVSKECSNRSCSFLFLATCIDNDSIARGDGTKLNFSTIFAFFPSLLFPVKSVL